MIQAEIKIEYEAKDLEPPTLSEHTVPYILNATKEYRLVKTQLFHFLLNIKKMIENSSKSSKLGFKGPWGRPLLSICQYHRAFLMGPI